MKKYLKFLEKSTLIVLGSEMILCGKYQPRKKIPMPGFSITWSFSVQEKNPRSPGSQNYAITKPISYKGYNL